jgi:hypothetical protein
LSQADFFGKAGKISIKNLKNPVKKVDNYIPKRDLQAGFTTTDSSPDDTCAAVDKHVQKQMI